MSDESHHPEHHRETRFLGAPRQLTPKEKAFLNALMRLDPAGVEKIGQLDSCVVQDMDDGGMGSLHFQAVKRTDRRLGRALIKAEFLDLDGVPVSIVINLDDRGDLFELDVWKVDFSKLIAFPRPQDMKIKIAQLR
jgi:hypothetical protein